MRERQRVEMLRDLLAAQGFRSIVDLAAVMDLDSGTRVTEAA